MEKEEIVNLKIAELFKDKTKINKIENLALKDAFESVNAINNADEINGAYTKHSAHTKTSTRGCVAGCLGG
jgi:hypothetical protein